nr:hypothetical protein GCM10020092_018030 [Actinoplanes digitatis]
MAILACGIDRPYPMGNTAMFEQIADSGVLMSEWPPGAEPLRHRFLIRNRVIAAATAGTVIVEAAARSGAVQTMGRTIALNRRAMVVPGPVTSAMSVGCHELLRKHPEVTVVTGLPHVLDEVGKIGEYLAEVPRGRDRPHDGLDEESALVLEAMPRRGTADPQELAAKAGLGVRTVLRRLSLLEMAEPGGTPEQRGGASTLTEMTADCPDRAVAQIRCRGSPRSAAGRGSRARKPGAEAGRGSRARKPGAEAGRGSRARKPGAEAGRGSRARKPGAWSAIAARAPGRSPSGFGVVDVAAVDLHPGLDVLGHPDLALREIGDGRGEVRPARDLVCALATHSAQADTDLVRTHQSDRLSCHMIDRRRMTISHGSTW